ncbi:MAG: hypothetical protein E7052_01025 [Lentisphaerae bacterium]|nr:hypothetical protein [Lentisphaerota bacterium]
MSIDPRQFDFTRRRWKWHFLPPEVAGELAAGAAPEELVCVKATETRAVYRFENYFIKVSGSYRLREQLNPAAKREYQAYCQLQKNSISAVKHLGWGRCGHYTALVTEVWSDDAVDALNYWYSLVYKVQDTGDFLEQLSLFLQKIVNSPLKHGDFHLGNILYSPGRKDFTLVDLHNVAVGSEPTLQQKAVMLRILAELRSSVKPQKMLDMFWQIAGIDADMAAAEIRKKLLKDTERNLHDWPRRVKQFLNGYSKFSDFVEYNNAVLLVQRNKLRKNLFDPSAAARGEYRTLRLEFSAALEQMLFSFYLSMLQVPHIPVAALAPNGTLYYPKMPEFCCVPEDREWVNNYNEYLLCMGLHLEDYQQWRHCSNSQLMLADFSSMLAAMPDREIFRPAGVDPRSWHCRRK